MMTIITQNRSKYKCRRATRGRGGGLPCPFFFKKSAPDFIHLWVKFSIQGIVLRVSMRKNSQIFPVEPFFLVFVNEIFIKVPWFHETCPPALKKFWLCAWIDDKKKFKHYMVYVIMTSCIHERLIHIQKLFQEFWKNCVLWFE